LASERIEKSKSRARLTVPYSLISKAFEFSPSLLYCGAVVGESLEYLSENELLINGYSGPADEVRVADPDEIVVLVIWPDGGLSIGRTGPIPEHFFQPSDQ
jgi:hypothetical protein